MVEAPAPGGTLYVVATPIGNLGDITLRALEVLRTVPLAAAEDTRIARRLWARYDIATRLVSYHAKSGTRRHAELIEHLGAGNDLALVSDAGTPLVSDPGGELVADWLALGGAAVPIPGASAVLAALVVSGFAAPRWAFEGFLPRSGRERRVRLARIAADERATVLFESARRAGATLSDLAEVCGIDRRAALTRELTKIHEETWRGSMSELAAKAGATPPRGEVTIVVEGADPNVSSAADAEAVDEARSEVDRLVSGGISRSSAARQVAQERNLRRRDLY
ncbi:MAG TPA: 16S rRNA (cytidine(1402)-2'-O)-methyltransferase [Candidatus Limnocylindrales bacterium]|nr:16S rRNA (cytidine(1402)-2'-O)-methyltransferase [Candidatus Limnocylindrales bacterium]